MYEKTSNLKRVLSNHHLAHFRDIHFPGFKSVRNFDEDSISYLPIELKLTLSTDRNLQGNRSALSFARESYKISTPADDVFAVTPSPKKSAVDVTTRRVSPVGTSSSDEEASSAVTSPGEEEESWMK
jgi:hypothetical protein